jgi:hypothetical protein
MEKELTRCRRRWSVVAMQLGSLRLPAGGGGEEQERSGEHRTTQAAESRRSRPGGGGGMNGKDPVRAFVCRRRFLATQATAELRASLLSLSPHLMGWDRRGGGTERSSLWGLGSTGRTREKSLVQSSSGSDGRRNKLRQQT